MSKVPYSSVMALPGTCNGTWRRIAQHIRYNDPSHAWQTPRSLTEKGREGEKKGVEEEFERLGKAEGVGSGRVA